MTDVTQILSQIETGDPKAAAIFAVGLRGATPTCSRKAGTREAGPDSPGDGAHAREAFMRLVDQSTPQQWGNSRHFFSAAAESMRRILIERARQRASLKRGGDRERIELDAVEPSELPLACDDILGLDEALQKLEQEHPRKAELVKLRFFAGLTLSQAAQALEVSPSTAENDWTYARSWLRLAMSGDGNG